MIREDKDRNRGKKSSLQGEYSINSPNMGSIATLNPKLKASRSIPPIGYFPGKKAAIIEYPGINITKGIPKIALRKELGKTSRVIPINAT
jgi:hypothetical protein